MLAVCFRSVIMFVLYNVCIVCTDLQGVSLHYKRSSNGHIPVCIGLPQHWWSFTEGRSWIQGPPRASGLRGKTIDWSQFVLHFPKSGHSMWNQILWGLMGHGIQPSFAPIWHWETDKDRKEIYLISDLVFSRCNWLLSDSFWTQQWVSLLGPNKIREGLVKL